MAELYGKDVVTEGWRMGAHDGAPFYAIMVITVIIIFTGLTISESDLSTLI